MAIRVVVADDSLLVREGLQQILGESPAIEIVDSCEDYDALTAAVARHSPELVLTDVPLLPSNTDEGIKIAARLRETSPRTGVIVLSERCEPSFVLRLLEGGSDRRGYLLKDRVRDRREILSAIDAVVRGGSVIDPKVVETLVAARARAGKSPLAELTPREREVLAEIAQGKSNLAIAASLTLTKRGVEKHINSIFMKLGLSTAEDVSKRVKAALVYLAEEHQE